MLKSTSAKVVSLLSSNPFICAPMVKGSEAAFRMLVRKYGVNLAYSPMIKSHLIVRGVQSELAILESVKGDEPLVVQLCGRSPEQLAEAARIVLQILPTIDGIDLNLGCPQHCAEVGKYGAFLLEEPELTAKCVAALCQVSKNIPVFCKIRIGKTIEETVRYGSMLQNAGCSMLAVHCRLREHKHDGLPRYEHATALSQRLEIPIVINGGIRSAEQARQVMMETGAQGAMAASGLLANHRMFQSDEKQDGGILAQEYLEYCKLYPPPDAMYIRKHLRHLLRATCMPDPGVSYREAARAEDGWRLKIWTFLVRPELNTLEQFVELIRMYRHHAGTLVCETEEDIPSFKNIKAMMKAERTRKRMRQEADELTSIDKKMKTA